MNIVLTGATGLLGRNLLFEFIKQYINDLDSLSIILLGRKEASTTLQERINKIVLEDGFSYIGDRYNDNIQEFARARIHCIEIDLNGEDLHISTADIYKLKARSIDFFFHIASVTDFRDSESVKNLLWESNIKGTERILSLVKQLDVQEFCYVSSAYCCGQTSGEIMPDYINLNQEFRNPYELSKLKAEIITRDFAKEHGIRYRCFRPSTISGRLIEHPLGTIDKFDVFYGWGAFWLHSKLRKIENIDRAYTDRITLNARIYAARNSGLNIVPADYAAKVMYEVCAQRDCGESYHIVNNEETQHDFYLAEICRSLNIEGIEFVDIMPTDLNQIESFYYKTVGRIFAGYLSSQPMLFSTTNLESVLAKSNLACPKIDRTNFGILMNFAINNNFGINLSKFTRTQKMEQRERQKV
ncbi:SDR family oxidoreductase [Chamaesiphon sp. OTE_75_metabat_556]|uniref:SDR family oxidoreductase n=1 Tax=Chamaesiphon sp. OTE_75_metabat_556 TaxID=2964692 RepID=UPI00286C91BE|nr:SDR family oxidoreductase [Chamaesiphon sp. OTE_75_metabat_556]